MQKITPNLWFDNEAEEAAHFYTGIFKDSKLGRITRYGKEGYEFHKKPEGTAMTVEFEIQGQTFVALNGGPQFKFNEAISFIINCDTQEDVDHYWTKLTEGGEEGPCGWLKDKYGLSWQVVPTALGKMFTDPDAAKVQRISQAMFTMKKLDLNLLKQAFEG